MQSKKEFLDDIAMSLGGFVAEKEVFHDVTTGASNDLQVLTNLAHSMVRSYGMSDKIGTIALADDPSEKVSADIDAEVKKIIDEAYKKAHDIIKEHRKLLNAIANRLVEKETMERDEFEAMLVVHGITPKKKEEISVEPVVVNF